MIRTILLAGAALPIASAPAMAATSTTKPAATRAVPAKPAVPATKVAAARRATPATPARRAARTASAAKAPSRSGMVTTRLANGKKVTYDCHLAGNKTKAACKGVG